VTYRVECDVAVDEVSKPGEAWKLMVDYMGTVFPHGRRAFAMFVGPSDADAMLRLDVDADAGRAAVTWLPDGSVGAEPGVPACHVPLSVCESSDREPVRISADRAIVTPGAALDALEEYVSTGRQPVRLAWAGRVADVR
jgi:hypothetical protein